MRIFFLFSFFLAAVSMFAQTEYNRLNSVFYASSDDTIKPKYYPSFDRAVGVHPEPITGESIPATIPAQQAYIYASIGGAGYELEFARPSGPDFRGGILCRVNTLAIHGGGGYSAYYDQGQDRNVSLWSFEGGMGFFLLPNLAVTVNVVYDGEKSGNDGAFGFNLRPIFHAVSFSKGRGALQVTGAAGFTDDFFRISGGLGVAWKLN